MNALIEKQALKELVDTFSNLADEKKVAEQMPLFTENAVVNTYIGGELVFAMTGRAEIEHVFSTFLTPFHTVYHLNGQFTVTDLQADSGSDYLLPSAFGGRKRRQKPHAQPQRALSRPLCEAGR